MKPNFTTITTRKWVTHLLSHLACKAGYIFLLVLFPAKLFSQIDAPTISGKVNISIHKGTFNCDLVLRYPFEVEGEYVIRLNAGMNIKSFTDISTNQLLDYDIDRKDTLSSGESLAYYFQSDRRKNSLLKTGVRLKYGGMFPVIVSAEKDFMAQDWRGNVAFVDGTLRVDGLQSAWYPVIFNKNKQRTYEHVKYNIEFKCSDCKTMFINGNEPKVGKIAKFITNTPYQMTLFCGQYDSYYDKNQWQLNTGMNKEQRKEFTSTIQSFETYYETKLKIPYTENITFIQATPAAPPTHAFLFVSYPTILNIGVGKYSLKNIFQEDQAIDTKCFLAHELAHYYFGYRLKTNTVFGSIINEGFAEYLALKLTKDIISDSVFKKKTKDQINALKRYYPNPLDQISDVKDFKGREFFVRRYIPMLLLAIEKEIGSDDTWKWLALMVNSKPEYTDYDFFKNTFLSAYGVNDKSSTIIKKYFTNPKASDEIMNTLSTGD